MEEVLGILERVIKEYNEYEKLVDLKLGDVLPAEDIKKLRLIDIEPPNDLTLCREYHLSETITICGRDIFGRYCESQYLVDKICLECKKGKAMIVVYVRRSMSDLPIDYIFPLTFDAGHSVGSLVFTIKTLQKNVDLIKRALRDILNDIRRKRETIENLVTEAKKIALMIKLLNES